VTVTVKKNSTTEQVYAALRKRLNMSEETSKCFALFELLDPTFERKIRQDECPHALYIQNYSSAAATCIILKKWMFNLSKELSLCRRDPFANNICFWQAVNDVNAGQIRCGEQLYELKALQDVRRKEEYLNLVRTLPGYGEITFPHCPCDSRKDGHITASVGYKFLRLQACRADGVLEDQVLEITWTDILEYALDADSGEFVFEYARPGKKPRRVKIFSQYASFLYDCVARIKEEMAEERDDGSENGTAAGQSDEFSSL